ncbi:putative protein WF-5 [Wolbachia endosymbiont of Wuchereria bancrofti]|nr:putative protein WF-5 [Wolbachia endosymbiont of Wuchereria bancrofti]
MNFDWLINNIKPEHLKRIDFIVTCRLSSDKAGSLALYKNTTLKKNNRNGPSATKLFRE